jgi:4,5-DOPA dioxygenase extradiol
MTLFVSHGAPNLVLHNSEARSFLAAYGRNLSDYRGILVVSAHYEAPEPHLTAGAHPPMIYDFGGFEPELRTIVYPAPGSPSLAAEAAEVLRAAGFAPSLDELRGYDHGTWAPLALLRPEADLPVVQLSVSPNHDASWHYQMGEALRSLAVSGVLIIGSGAATHNLHEFFRGGYRFDTPAPDWVRAFGNWLDEKATQGDVPSLLDYRRSAPFGRENHPTEEHLLPFFVALGAAGEGARGERIHSSHQYGVLMMDCYAFA